MPPHLNLRPPFCCEICVIIEVPNEIFKDLTPNTGARWPMEEKISVYVSSNVAETLEYDARLFEIYKSNSSSDDISLNVNMNHFLSKLLIGYIDLYNTECQTRRNEILDIINNRVGNSLDASIKEELKEQIFQKMFIKAQTKQKGKHSKKLSLKPTRETKAILDDIESNPQGDTVSGFLSKVFASYTDKAISEREKIIFNDTYVFLDRCCKDGKAIRFQTINNSRFRDVIPYKIVKAKEEMSNYLLCGVIDESGNIYAQSYRLSRIVAPKISDINLILSQNVINNLMRMEQNGPQFAINDDEDTIVRFVNTDRQNGKSTYRSIYFGRPTPYGDQEQEQKHEGIYRFGCSTSQSSLYFRRFNDVEVLAPAKLRNEIIEFHKKALECYENPEF